MIANHVLVSVVDGDESVRESLPDLLRDLGFAAEAFASGEEFLASGQMGRDVRSSPATAGRQQARVMSLLYAQFRRTPVWPA